MSLYTLCFFMSVLLTGGEAIVTVPAVERSYKAYDVIVERNIFSRYRLSQRRAEREADSAERSKSKAANVVLSYYVLKGVAINGGAKVAFVEEALSGQTLRVGVGDELAGGMIREIGSAEVIFDLAGQQMDVYVGAEFRTGQTSADSSKNSSTTGSADDPSAGADVDESEVLRKMLERRKQETGL